VLVCVCVVVPSFTHLLSQAARFLLEKDHTSLTSLYKAEFDALQDRVATIQSQMARDPDSNDDFVCMVLVCVNSLHTLSKICCRDLVEGQDVNCVVS
jgi:hypothetical protein